MTVSGGDAAAGISLCNNVIVCLLIHFKHFMSRKYTLAHIEAFFLLSKPSHYFFQRYPTDRAYFIAKEILMTERTYKKDLEIINLVSIFAATPNYSISILFHLIRLSQSNFFLKSSDRLTSLILPTFQTCAFT